MSVPRKKKTPNEQWNLLSVAGKEDLYAEFRHRFRVEFDEILEHTALAKVMFEDSDQVESRLGESPIAILHTLWGSSFHWLAVSLNRVWDTYEGDIQVLSIPSLVKNHGPSRHFGCHGLLEGREDRTTYDKLMADPIRERLKVARNEFLAHPVAVGKSSSREKSDLLDAKGYRLENGDVVEFAEKTLELLHAVVSQLTNFGKRPTSNVQPLLDAKILAHRAFFAKVMAVET